MSAGGGTHPLRLTGQLSMFKSTCGCRLQEVGLVVSDVVVLIDREQGGRAHLDKHGLKPVSYTHLTLPTILRV